LNKQEAYQDVLRKQELYNRAYCEYGRARDNLVETYGPYKVGDIVPAKSYSYENRMCHVDAVSLNDDLSVVVRATVLRSNGTLSRNKVEWTDLHDDSLKLENILR
jgi:hypothetical protein